MVKKELGVHRIDRIVNGKYDRRWVARWRDRNGKQMSKSFSISKFGEEGAHIRVLKAKNRAEVNKVVGVTDKRMKVGQLF